MRKLDFIVIGAQKAGTTSLFRYMQAHPLIYVPPEKEAPYFDRDDRLQRGWDWYTDEFFHNAPQDNKVLRGTVTPQYLSDIRVSQRIAELLPQVKLIAILRNPIERAYSHYRMVARWGAEEKTFSEAIDYLLTKPLWAQARTSPKGLEYQNLTYIAWGEYGRLLSHYHQLFNPAQLLILFTEHLAQAPLDVVRTVLQYLNLEDTFVPPNINKRYHVGGNKKRIKGLEKLHDLSIWRTLFPRNYRKITYWLRQWNTVSAPPSEPIDAETRDKLTDFYRNDVQHLSQTFNILVPWTEWRNDITLGE